MKQIFFFFFVAVSPIIVFSQDEIANTINPLIKNQLYDSANKVADKYLKEYPKSPDAYVAKGNIIFYRYSHSEPGIALNGNPDESIYETTMGSISENAIILPVETADSITTLLLKGLAIDKTRIDIYNGCCYVYSLALQTGKLCDMLGQMKRDLKTDSTTPYDWSDYARNMMERNHFEEGMQVYYRIAQLFPGEGGTWSDMAAEYYKQGDLKRAHECADTAFMMPYYDGMTCRNIAFIYGVLEDYPKASAANKKWWMKEGDVNDYMIYDGLLALNEKNDKSIFREYLKEDKTTLPGREIANYIVSDSFKLNLDSYRRLSNIELNDAYKILIHKYFKNHTSLFLPAFNYAEALTYNFRYDDAVKAFDEIKTDTISKSEKENFLFYSAWACYKAGKQEKANEKWEQLLNSDDFYRKSAAAYFLGKYYFGQDKHSLKAVGYCNLVAADYTKSKYAAYCKNMLDGKAN